MILIPVMRAVCLLNFVLLCTGCAVSSSIENVASHESEFDGAIFSGKTSSINAQLPGVEKYRIFHQGSTGFTSVETIRNSAMKRVDAFCAQSGKRPYLIEETTSKPPHILGNWPRTEIVFSCIATAPLPQDKYDNLSKLKALLDSGAITQHEFEVEKKKVLSK